MNTLIRATVFLRTTDWTLLRFDCFEKGKNKVYEDDVEIIIKQIQNNNPRADERNKLQTGNGSWSFKVDDNRVGYLVLTSNDYPERKTFAMIKVFNFNIKYSIQNIKEMEMELKKLPNYQNLAPKEVDKVIKAFIKDLQDKYNNLLGIDKIAQAQAQIDDVKLVMEENVRKMIDNGGQVDQLDHKADEMKNKAKVFQQQSTDLARIMYYRNLKLKIAIGLIVLCVLLYISVPLIISATAASNSSDSDSSSENSGSKPSSAASHSRRFLMNI